MNETSIPSTHNPSIHFHACPDTKIASDLQRFLRLVGKIDAEPFLAGNALAAELVVGAEAGGMGRFGHLAGGILLLEGVNSLSSAIEIVH